ncbi:uncharacterized protein YALI1_D00412g [Yarrowia lipolytica]|uniref:Uncharacterized protein n=1 Tax=Yarrowia lipolytica TaxID=4952 RepID=A0A1D8NCL3_YARLL|nr:hypothetical protein YALI1_D00412g [Yarrowia lipolytica]
MIPTKICTQAVEQGKNTEYSAPPGSHKHGCSTEAQAHNSDQRDRTCQVHLTRGEITNRGTKKKSVPQPAVYRFHIDLSPVSTLQFSEVVILKGSSSNRS